MRRSGDFFFLSVPGLAEKRPSVLRGDKIFVCVGDQINKSYQGYVHEVLEKEVKIKFSPELARK